MSLFVVVVVVVELYSKFLYFLIVNEIVFVNSTYKLLIIRYIYLNQ